jgi:hypothetical protein
MQIKASSLPDVRLEASFDRLGLSFGHFGLYFCRFEASFVHFASSVDRSEFFCLHSEDFSSVRFSLVPLLPGLRRRSSLPRSRQGFASKEPRLQPSFWPFLTISFKCFW